MKKAIILAFILHHVSVINCSAQQLNLDSLYAIWQNPSISDSIRAESFNKYIYHGFIFSNPDSAFVLAGQLITFGINKKYRKAEAMGLYDQGVTMSVKGNADEFLRYLNSSFLIMKEIGSKRGMLVVLSGMGMAHHYRGDYPKALDYLNQALKIFEGEDNKTGMPDLVNAIGVIYATQGDVLRALHYYNLSLKVNKDLGDERGIAFALSNIGTAYQIQGNFPEAIFYFNQALDVHKRMENQTGIALVLGSIGKVFTEQEKYSEAHKYYEQALDINRKLENGTSTANVLLKIGFNYKRQGSYTEAMDYYKSALNILKNSEDKLSLSGVQVSIGEVYNKQAKHAQAIVFCKQSLAITEEIGILEGQKASCQCLYDAYKAMGNQAGALTYLEKIRIVEDSLNTEEIALELQKMEFDKKMLTDSLGSVEEARLVQEAHLEEVRQKNQTRDMLAGGGLILVILAGGLFGRVRYIRKSKSVLQIEKDRSENLLLNILPEEIAQELKIYGKAEARDFNLVSILFTDFKGFTEASAKMSAGELVSEINICFEAFDHIMEKYSIEKIKTIGDAYMAAGGLPVPTDDSVRNTVLAALEMQEFIVQRHQTQVQRGKPAFEMRVGIHTGPVVAGIVGVKKFQYDIWGDTVNTASRMESSGEVGKVNISQATYELLKSDPQFEFESRGKIEAKGKGEIEMYFIQINTKILEL